MSPAFRAMDAHRRATLVPTAQASISMLGALVLALAPSGAVSAGCGVSSGELRLLSDDWEALHVVAERAESCAGEGVRVSIGTEEENDALLEALGDGEGPGR